MAAVQHTRTRSGRLFGRETKPTSAPTPNAAVASPAASHGPSPLTLFLTNLKLLDLDLLPDWPEISTETFATAGSSAQGQKKRVQCVEWALFQLFALWDPSETKNKLKPFFPPLDQVQSLNLRAALLRALEQAKKNGVLGRDAIVRKTMLDECKGERLEEVLAAFSSAVLKKVIGEELSESGEHPAIALGLALEERGYTRENMDLMVLGWTHKASLHGSLREKSMARDRFRGFSELLDAKEKEIATRSEAIRTKEQASASTTISKDVKTEMRRAIRNNWTGNERWMETLLSGDAGSNKDALLGMPFDRVWRRVQQNRLGDLEEQAGGLLAELEDRLRVQKERLQKLEGFKRRMCEERPRPPPSKQRATEPLTKGIDLGFSQHESLQIGRASPRRPTIAQKEPVLNEEYGTLVRDLEEELLQIDPKRSHALSFLQQPREHDANTEADSSFTDHNGEDVVSELSELEEDLEDPFVEDEPIKSFQEKLEQSKPRPVRPRISLSGNSSPSKSTTGSMTPRAHRGLADERCNREGGSPQRSGQTHWPQKPSEPSLPQLEPELTSEPELLPPPSPTQDLADQILDSMDMVSPSPVKRTKPRPTLTLADRTRLSLARKPSLFLEDEPDSPEGNTANEPLTQSPDEIPQTPASEEFEDLASRTRRSMAGFDKARQKAQLERRRSQRKAKVPPRKEGSYFPKVEETQEQSMLAEELMAEEDMEAVFKSRPKIKESPIPSPTRDGWGDDYL